MLHRAWKNKLRAVAALNQNELYQTLCILQSEMDVNIFQTRATQFVKVWSSQEPSFIKYFTDNYLNRAGNFLHVSSKNH